MKRRLAVPFAVAAVMAVLCLSFAPAFALNLRSFISGAGDDNNSCTRLDPCTSFAAAMAHTFAHGEIDCLDTGEFYYFIIAKSITIDCHGVVGGLTSDVTTPNTAGIVINFDLFDPSDTPPVVVLKNISINGAGDAYGGIFIAGAGSGSVVKIENCAINGSNLTGGSGIDDERNHGFLSIDNTKVSNNEAIGILIKSISNGSRRAVIKNTQVFNSGTGISVGSYSEVVISHSDISDNATAGLVVSASTGSAAVDSTTIAHNGYAFQNSGTVRLSNSDVAYNATAWTGTINTFTNNRFTNNGGVGPLVPIGTASNPTGEQ